MMPTVSRRRNLENKRRIITPSYPFSEDCTGVCVADRIAEYCEAYLTSDGLCKEGTKCCVSLDEYSNGKLPKDIYIPASNNY